MKPHPPRRDTPRERPRCRHRQGSVFVLVLGVTSLITVIGMSAMLAVRLQHQGAQDRADAAQAQQLADSALQIIHARLSNDPSWRTDHTHDTWTADETIAPLGGFRYKLTDEADADLSDDSDEPARLTVRATHGSAVRLVSVELLSGQTLGPELLSNPDMEAGNAGYSPYLNPGSITAYTNTPRGGTKYLQYEGRLFSTSSLTQNMAGKITSGKTYRVAAWVRMESSATNAKLGFYYVNILIPYLTTFSAPAGTGWTYVHADLTPTFGFSPTVMLFCFGTATTSQDIHIDDASIREVLSTSLPVVRGSYRRELDP